jgi:hypothetical protein
MFIVVDPTLAQHRPRRLDDRRLSKMAPMLRDLMRQTGWLVSIATITPQFAKARRQR